MISPRRGSDDFDHEADDGAGRVELAGIAGRVTHLLEHRLVEMAQGMNLFGRVEVNTVDLVDDVPEEIAVDHSVDRALEYRGDDSRRSPPLAPEAPQVGKEPGPFLAVGTDGFFVVDEAISSSPVMPSSLAAQSRQR